MAPRLAHGRGSVCFRIHSPAFTSSISPPGRSSSRLSASAISTSVALALLVFDVLAPVGLFIPVEWAFYRYHLLPQSAFEFWSEAIFYVPVVIEQKSAAYHGFFETQIVWSQPFLF